MRYAKITRLVNKLTKERKVLGEELLEELKSGKSSPRDSPYVLVLVTKEIRDVSWKALAEQLALETKSAKKLERMVEAAPTKPSYSIQVDVNTGWKG